MNEAVCLLADISWAGALLGAVGLVCATTVVVVLLLFLLPVVISHLIE